ncbi:PAS domain S-box protein [Amylibacter sp. SFDW26]|uniref:PAS domain-containing sensor histidine kinase n=1 Tax=Amylibacter sp. SFDW26 TaxID=2652722 RepID=UPI001261ACB4|nr:PAS domain-containing sensor histidine kinase [Amylibacter sp. SFDW26]KAB7614439.1 PAS domain S-box protein [Amylibacter sp. SFDW26]
MVAENKNNNMLTALLESAVDAIITIDTDANIRTINKSTETLFGYEKDELIGNNVKLLMPEPWASEHDEYIANYNKTGYKKIIGIGREVQGKRKDGSVFPMHLAVSEFNVDGQVFYAGIVHDLTARKLAERSLFQANKMESIGQLSGGIAHDFNNLLTIISGNLELLEMQLQDPIKLELLQEAQDAAAMGAELTNRLLSFARRSLLYPEVVDLGALIERIRPLLKRSLGNLHDFRVNFENDLWPVQVDANQAESAIVNLAVNAKDALNNKGLLVIEASNFTADQTMDVLGATITFGDYVRLSVSDNGSGMSNEAVQKAFDPFFTTKEVGKGTGLGLSMVHGFCKQSGGHTTIYSELGYGTTVNMYLPRYIDNKHVAEVSPSTPKSTTQGKGQLILVVEDDKNVRRLAVQRLESLSYEVVEAKDGNHAKEMLQTHPDIQLVFTDLIMPGRVSGQDLALYIKLKYPDIKVLLTSGYSKGILQNGPLSDLKIEVLRKPYGQAELAQKIAKIWH